MEKHRDAGKPQEDTAGQRPSASQGEKHWEKGDLHMLDLTLYASKTVRKQLSSLVPSLHYFVMAAISMPKVECSEEAKPLTS